MYNCKSTKLVCIVLFVFLVCTVKSAEEIHKATARHTLPVVCGDGICLLSELCICGLDCGVCVQNHTCPVDNSGKVCNGNGVCVLGACVCDSSWTGLNCELAQIPIIATCNETAGIMNMVANSSTFQIPSSFNIQIVKLVELSTTNQTVQTVNLTQWTSLNWDFTNSYEFWKLQTGGIFSGKTYTVTLTMFSYNNTQQIPFADETIVLAPNSVKFTLEIDWPLQQEYNKLQVFVQTSSLGYGEQIPQTDINNNVVAASTLVVGGGLHARYSSRAVLDGTTIVIVKNSWDAKTGCVVIEVPYFFVNAVIDPDYSVFFAPAASIASQTNQKVLTIALICAGLVVVGIIIGLIAVYVHKRPRTSSMKIQETLEL